jgi:hypothetical protein
MQHAGRMISSFPSSRHRAIFFRQNPRTDLDAHPPLDQLERRLLSFIKVRNLRKGSSQKN